MKRQRAINLKAYKRLSAAAGIDQHARWMITTCKDLGATRGRLTTRDRKTGWKVQLIVSEQ